MGTTARVRWGRIGLGAFFAEAAVLAVFFLVLGIAQLAGVRELAAPMTPLDYAEALVFSFVSVFVFTLWVARPLIPDSSRTACSWRSSPLCYSCFIWLQVREHDDPQGSCDAHANSSHHWLACPPWLRNCMKRMPVGRRFCSMKLASPRSSLRLCCSGRNAADVSPAASPNRISVS